MISLYAQFKFAYRYTADDNNGNLTGDGTWTYSWDYKNRLATSTATSTISYGYDHTGQRVRKTTNNINTFYPNKYYNVSNATTTKHIFTPSGQLIATIEGNGIATTTNYIHPDHLGGTHVVTNSSGQVIQRIQYYPFGKTRTNTQGTNFDERRKFTGHEYDTESDLTYANARYYQQNIGRWISMDPASRDNPEAILVSPQKLNYYTYGGNNPIAFIDVSGLSEAYFASRQVFPFLSHIYQAYSIDSQEEANQLNIGVPVPSNVNADNPFNFTIGFGSIGGTLTGGVGYAGGLGDNAWSRDYSHASRNSFDSTGFNLSMGAYNNYAQLANASYNVSQVINSAGVPYFALGNSSVFSAIALRNYYNSNSAMSEVANSTGQSDTYNQFLSTVNAPGENDGSISVTSSGRGSVAQSTASSLIGNNIGKFVGTYNFGPNVGTYDFGKRAWVE